MNEPVIQPSEFQTRLAALRAAMARENADLFMAFSNLLDPSAVRYFTDFSAVNESGAFLVTGTRATLCSGQASYDYALVKNKLACAEIKVFPEIGEVSGFEYDYGGQMDFADYFREIAAAERIGRIALAGKLTFPAVIYNKLKAAFPDAEIVDFDGALYEMRFIKSESEISCMKKACEIATKTFEDSVPAIEAGMTERQIQGIFEMNMAKYGAESAVMAFAPMVATGSVNSHVSMCRNSLRRVKEGEILNIAAGVCYEGYNGIICSPHVLGPVPAKIKDAVKCAYDALNLASSKMKPGAGAREILNTYTDYLTKKGYIAYCPYGSLHSTGMLECEAPVFSVENNRMIRENMTICIDAYFKGMEWGSFRIEDVYRITKNGAERITAYNDSALPVQFFR